MPTEYGMDYYTTCPETTMGGIGEYGAIESHKPQVCLLLTNVYNVYASIRQFL